MQISPEGTINVSTVTTASAVLTLQIGRYVKLAKAKCMLAR